MDEIIVEPTWIDEHAADGIALVDTRPEPFYQQAHLPGAVNLPTYIIPGFPPDPEAAARLLGSLGITRATPVVAYDDGASTNAAVLYWVLRYLGHPQIVVLNGGITRWRHDGRDWEYAPTPVNPVEYEVGEVNREALAGLDDVQAALGEPDTVILDVRAPSEYLGLQGSASRNGHIPGAVNIDWTNNLTRTHGGVAVLKSPDELRALYETAGITPDKEIIVHCQAGGRSSETYLVLTALGYPHVRNYVAGWQEWGNDAGTAVEGP